MYFLLYGEDTFRSRKKLSAMREQFALKRDAVGLNSSHLRAKENDVEEVGAALFASPFLAERKFVVLEGFLQASAAVQEKVRDMLPRKPESTNVVFFEDANAEDLAKSALFAVLKTQKFTEEHTKMGGAALEVFVVEECAAQNVTIGPREARTLVGIVGDDPWALHEEIAKLCAYASAMAVQSGAAGGAASAKIVVSPAMLETLIPGAKEESLFALVDACVDGTPAAAAMLERMIEAGTSELQLLAMLQKQFRTLIAVVDLVQRGERDKNVVARRVGIHPFPASKAIAAAPRYDMAVLRKRYDELLEIERGIKTSAAKPNALLGLWLAKARA